MPIALLKLIPFRDYAYAALAIAAVIFYNVHVHNKEVQYNAQKMAAVQAEGARVEKAAEDRITALNTQHAKEHALQETQHESEMVLADAQRQSDVDRVRKLDADREANARLGGAAGGVGSGTACTNGPGSLEDRFRSLEQVAIGLRAAGNELNAALNEYRTDRDSLTGK